MTVANKVMAQSDAQGALPTLFAATQDVPGGSFIGPDGFQQTRGYPELVSPQRRRRRRRHGRPTLGGVRTAHRHDVPDHVTTASALLGHLHDGPAAVEAQRGDVEDDEDADRPADGGPDVGSGGAVGEQ